MGILSIARMDCQNLYKSESNAEEKNVFVMLIRRVTANLGKLLELTNRNQTAIKVYKTIEFVSSIIRVYKKLISKDF